MIFNYLDHLTIEEVLKYYNSGLELIINDGHIQALQTDEEEKDDV